MEDLFSMNELRRLNSTSKELPFSVYSFTTYRDERCPTRGKQNEHDFI